MESNIRYHIFVSKLHMKPPLAAILAGCKRKYKDYVYRKMLVQEYWL